MEEKFRWEWIVIIFRDNHIFDSILEDKTYKSEELCQKAIENAIKEDFSEGWIYDYSDPIQIAVYD